MKLTPHLHLALVFASIFSGAGCQTRPVPGTTPSSRPGRSDAASWGREQRLWGTVHDPIYSSSEPGGHVLREAPTLGTPPGLWPERSTALSTSSLQPAKLQPSAPLGTRRQTRSTPETPPAAPAEAKEPEAPAAPAAN